MSEQLYHNGNIITLAHDEPIVEAIFIKNGTIEMVGTTDSVFTFRTNDTELIDLQGKTILPSFIDPHSHITAFASTLHLVNLSDTKSFAEIINKLKEQVTIKHVKKGKWIIGFGYDQNNLQEKETPTKDILDAVTTDHPIIISHASGHMGVVNSFALKELHITSETPNPDGGVIGKNRNNNEPNGYLEENAFFYYSAKVPKPNVNEMSDLMAEAQSIYFSYGITMAQEGKMNEPEFSLLKKLADERRLIIDVVGYVDLKNSKWIADNHKKFWKHYTNGFRIGGYKIFLDGSPQGKTAWLTKPYQHSYDGYKGYPIYKDKEVEDFINTSLKEKMQLLTHCNGDAAADQLLQSFLKVLTEQKEKEEIRPVMIHAQTVRHDQIDLMKKINMIPSYFVAHTFYWGDTHIYNLGKERAENISPIKTTIEKGVRYTLHQDTPVVPPDMFHTIWCAVNRFTKSGVVLGKNERITPLDALKGVTINAAYQYGEEKKKGSIQKGKQANLIIIDQNPLTINPLELKNIKILQTIKEGKIVYYRQ